MIEVICDETEQGAGGAQIPVKLPKNLRQIGEGTNDTKIYLEDFVVTYIHKFADKDKDSAGILLGEVKQSGKETYIFVPGAIEIKNAFSEEGSIRFDDEVWSEIYATIKQYFNKYMIVGWFLNRRSSCHEVDSQLSKIHIDNFPGTDKILFLSDVTEKEEAVYHVENAVLTEQSVYYVYYERNVDMQEYMTAGKEGEELPQSVDAGLEDKAPESYRAILRERKEESSGKHVIGILYGACTFLAVVILMIGVAMMNNYDKIAGLEQLVSDLYEAAMERAGQQSGEVVNNDEAIIDNVTGNIWPTKSTDKDANSTKITVTEPTGETTGEQESDSASTADTGTTTDAKEESMSTTTTANDDTTKATDTISNNPVSYYVVQEGDTLTSISRKFYNTDKMVEAIKAFNQIEDENYIFTGQVINLP